MMIWEGDLASLLAYKRKTEYIQGAVAEKKIDFSLSCRLLWKWTQNRNGKGQIERRRTKAQVWYNKGQRLSLSRRF
jgi:hypothetical protein